jgi:hypothetical protein
MGKDGSEKSAASESHGGAPDKGLSTLVNDLQRRFLAAVALFNAHSKNLFDMFDDNVVVFSVSSNRPVVGKPAVIEYFKQQFTDVPKFSPLEPVSYTPANAGSPAITGTVEGSARWVDTNGAETISFVFTMVRQGGTILGDWMIVSMWGS